jgi:hypothetical protein
MNTAVSLRRPSRSSDRACHIYSCFHGRVVRAFDHGLWPQGARPVRRRSHNNVVRQGKQNLGDLFNDLSRIAPYIIHTGRSL